MGDSPFLGWLSGPFGWEADPIWAKRQDLVGRERELARLHELLGTARTGGASSLLIIGEAGMGKSALLESVAAAATDFQVVRAAGVEREADLPYAGLHQLCRSLVGSIDALPEPQADALGAAFGLTSAGTSDPYLVGLAVLGLLSEVAAERPLLCVVDDAQWLDHQTLHALAFVARRLGADSVALAMGSRATVEQFDDVPVLELAGLAAAEARVLLGSVTVGRLDGPIRERFLTETHGNPLALLELPHTLTPAEVSAGIARLDGGSLTARIESSFRERIEALPVETQQLLLLAATEPVGDPLLLLRALEHAGLPVEAADAAVDARLFEVRDRWVFRHPLVRSAVYRSAGAGERRLAHQVLADVTDEAQDADRKAWHRAQATSAPDEEVAVALERTAVSAKVRGGLAAAGAFLERSALLTPDPSQRVERSIAAADVLLDAGMADSVEGLLGALEGRGLTELQAMRVVRLRARMELARQEGDKRDAVLRLLEAGTRLQKLDPVLGRTVHAEALHAATELAPDVVVAVVAALDSVQTSGPPTPVELVLRGFSALYTDGFPAGTDELRRAASAIRDAPELQESDLDTLEFAGSVAVALWDLESLEVTERRATELARQVGAMSRLPRLLEGYAAVKIYRGDLRAAEALLAEAEAVSDAIRSPGLDHSILDAVAHVCDEALLRIDKHQVQAVSPDYEYNECRAIALLGAGRYEQALEVAQRASDGHPGGVYGRGLVTLIEAAVRSGELERARAAMMPLAERTQLSGTDWALGLEARCRALVSDDDDAEACYGEAVERLARAGARPDLGRAHLLYGEWLRRAKRRMDAREQLRTAHDIFTDIGMPGFAERARRELVATGETARKRIDAVATELTAQESQIARLAADGLTNSEIGAQLYLSPRTVEWHLTHIYPKLGITTRRGLSMALQNSPPVIRQDR